MKLPRVLSQRPTPRMPLLAGFEPRFDPIPAPHGAGLDQVFRPAGEDLAYLGRSA